MKKTFTTVFAVMILITANAQTRNIIEELAKDPKLAYGTDYPYMFEMKELTASPKGYKVFYISHYGRYGSRYFWGDYLYPNIDTLLTTAHDKHILTEKGEQFYYNYKAALPELMTGWGELTDVGWKQHTENGAEATLPVSTSQYPYYKWSDLLTYYTNKIKTLTNE